VQCREATQPHPALTLWPVALHGLTLENAL